jgi:hypothetical protein
MKNKNDTVNFHLKAHAPLLGGTLYRRIQPTVIIPFFVTETMRYSCTTVGPPFHHRYCYIGSVDEYGYVITAGT